MRQRRDLRQLGQDRSGTPRVHPLERPIWRGEPLNPEAFARAWRERGADLLDEVTGRHGLVVVDPARGEVTIVRGPHGSEPIYYRLDGSTLEWGDRLADVATGLERRVFSREAVRDVLNYRWSLGRTSLVAGVEQTRTGEAVTVSDDGAVSSRFVHDIRFAPSEPEGDLGDYAEATIEALTRSLEASLADAERPAVLLSGGTDSSILAALAMRIRPDVLAVTPTWRDHPDPELERARRYAEHMGVEHRVVVIGDEEVPRAVAAVARGMEQPPRTNWAFALELCLAALDGTVDVVAHGMAADTLFGSTQVVFVREFERKSRIARWIPGRKLLGGMIRSRAGRARRLRTLLTLDPAEAFLLSSRTTGDSPLAATRPDLFGDRLPDPALLEVAWTPDHPLEERAQRFGILAVGQAQMLQLSRVGSAYGARFVFPFLESPALETALRLPPSLRYVDGHTKPVLRVVSERLFSPEWARWPKLAFPMPNRAWRKGSLRPWFDDRLGPGSWGRSAFGDTLDALDADTDEDLVWTLAYLDEVALALDVERALGGPA